MRRILATDFGIWPMLQNLGQASDSMVLSPEYWSRLANYVLLYDQIVIPTGNFQILPVLRLMLGEGAFDDLVSNKGIVLARFDQWIGYAGNGAGVVFFTIQEDPLKPSRGPNLGTAFFRPLEESIDTALQLTNPPSSKERHAKLKNLLLDNIIQLPTPQIIEGLKEESYRDIQNSPYLRDFLAFRNAGRPIDHLTGLAADKVVIFNPHVPPEPEDSLEIRAVLRVVFENFLLSVGGHASATEITGDNATLSVLQAKGQRLGLPPQGDRAFAQILKINGIPDLGSAFASKQLSSTQILDLRYSKHCQALRDWFEAGSPGESAEATLQRYVESIGKPALIDSLPLKLLRFAATTGIGMAGPIAGAAASVLDSFLLSKWFPCKSARLFMKQAKVMLSNSPIIQKPNMKGRNRNQPCSCGSGKKLKYCCGA